LIKSESDWYGHVPKEKYDVIVSNPPYISENDPHLKALSFEPQLALISGKAGMDAIREIIKHAKKYLKPAGLILLEHGYDQAEKVQTTFLEYQFVEVKTLKDLGGQSRVTIAKNA
jgi:release factor glutamine methyltransferase